MFGEQFGDRGAQIGDSGAGLGRGENNFREGGRALGEHWYSIYNCMLVGSGILMLIAARLMKRPALGWRVWDLTLCCAIASLGCKLFALPRPSGGPHGFPSGHALTAFAAACLLQKTFPRISPYAFIIAVGVGWSRVEIREHFVYQVLIGALMGVLVGTAVANARDNEGVLLPRILRRRQCSSPPSR